jgi:hypothetical protein
LDFKYKDTTSRTFDISDAMEDTMYQQLLNFYAAKESDKKYPESVYTITDVEHKRNAKQRFRQLAKPYSLHKGLLVHNANGKRLQVLQRLAEWNRC